MPDDAEIFKTETGNSALKCKKELIPVLAGECRASPITMPIEKNLIRSSSAEVNKNPDFCVVYFVFRMLLTERESQMNMQSLDDVDH